MLASIIIACFFGLLAVYSMIYFRAAAFICIVVMSCSSGLALWKWLTKHAYLEKKARIGCSVVLTAVILIAGWLLLELVPLTRINHEPVALSSSEIASEIIKQLPSSTNEPPFHVEIPQVFRGTYFAFGHDNVVSPIDVGLHIQVTNTQNVTSRIAGYTVQVAASSEGPWKSLLRLPVGQNEIYIIAIGDLTRAMTMTLLPHDNLAQVLSDRPFGPNETKEGWDFFERSDINTSDLKFIKFHIRDAAGKAASQTIPLPDKRLSGETNFQNAGLRFVKYRDISKVQFKRFHSAFPD
jgi:hypothetical protein